MVGQAAHNIALVNYVHGNYAKAATFCKTAITARRKSLGMTHHDLGQTYILMARNLAKQNWADEAEPYMTRGLYILEQSPGPKKLDYADGLRFAALFQQGRANKVEAENLFAKYYEINDAALCLDQPAQLKGLVRYRWEEGSPRSQEIPDVHFPLRYINAKNIRVAATIVDLWGADGCLGIGH